MRRELILQVDTQEAILQFSDSLHNLRRRHLSLDIRIEGKLAFGLLNPLILSVLANVARDDTFL